VVIEPTTHPDIRNAFDSITYTKGGVPLTMFDGYLGAEAFRTDPSWSKRSRVKPRKNCRNLQEGEKTGRRFHKIPSGLRAFL
jgi:hypothetical protein